MNLSKRHADTFEFGDQEAADKAEAAINALYPASAQLLSGAQVLVITEAHQAAAVREIAFSLGGKGWQNPMVAAE